MNDNFNAHCILAMTTSLKGGTGKSLFACALLDYLRTHGSTAAAYDGDGSIGTLSAMHATRDEGGYVQANQDPMTGVVAYDVRSESRRMLIESVGQFDGVVLHDLAGGAIADLQRLFDDEGSLQNLFGALINLQVRPIFIHLITPDKATVESVAVHLDMLDELGASGKIGGHLAVLNQRGKLNPKDYPFWYGFDESDGKTVGGKTRKRLLDHGGVEMMLPHIDERTLALTKNCNLPFSEAKRSSKMGIVDQQRVQLFISAFEKAMIPEVKAILGVDNDPQ